MQNLSSCTFFVQRISVLLLLHLINHHQLLLNKSFLQENRKKQLKPVQVFN